MGDVVCLVGRVAFLVGCLRGPVMIINMAGVVKKIWLDSGFGLKVMLVGSLFVLVTFNLNKSCVT